MAIIIKIKILKMVFSKLLGIILTNGLNIRAIYNKHHLKPDDKLIEEPRNKVSQALQNSNRNMIVIVPLILSTIFQIITVSPWTVLEGVSFVFLCASLILRLWAMYELDHFFTFIPAIRENHKLIKTGPYQFLLHPSYTGLIGVMLFNTLFTLEVFWSLFYKMILGESRDIYSIVLGLVAGFYLFSNISKIYFFNIFIYQRIPAEEQGMREKFGAEFDEYVNSRYRLIPFLY